MEATLKILILEDVPDDVGLVERVLRKEGLSCVLQRVDTREQFIQAMRNGPVDVILSDHMMPQFNSSDALKIFRRTGLQIPFILVTGTVSEEFAVSCLKQGADDYVLKGNLSRLPAAILTALKQREEAKKRRAAETALRQQNEELVKINKELDHFVYSASHNLRAPLMSVLGLLNVAGNDLQQNDTNHFHDYFRMMGESVHQLDETLKQIIDYSKNSRSEILFEKIDLRKLIDECLGRLRYLEESDGVEITVSDIHEQGIYSDAYRLSLILTNIVSNSIKYRDYDKQASWIRVDVTTGASTMIIRIEDNGIGIQSEFLPHVFEMFYRGSEKSHGAGLGLYIAKETVENLGGTISAEAAHHVGTILRVEIPYRGATEIPFAASKKLGELIQKNNAAW